MRPQLLGLTLLLGLLPPLAGAAPTTNALPKIVIGRDGRSFETTDGQPFAPFGVTYFRPGTGWAPQVWKQFDAEATRKDFSRMKELGVNCARVFLSYGSFLMETKRVSPDGLAKLERVVRRISVRRWFFRGAGGGAGRLIGTPSVNLVLYADYALRWMRAPVRYVGVNTDTSGLRSGAVRTAGFRRHVATGGASLASGACAPRQIGQNGNPCGPWKPCGPWHGSKTSGAPDGPWGPCWPWKPEQSPGGPAMP